MFGEHKEFCTMCQQCIDKKLTMSAASDKILYIVKHIHTISAVTQASITAAKVCRGDVSGAIIVHA